MNYSELPLEERIRMASDYALLLIEGSLLEEDVLQNLQEMFLLTPDQAMEALQRTRQHHSSEYKSLQNASIFRAVGAVLVSLVCGCFYVVLGEEAGMALVLFGVLFLLVGLFSFVVIIQKLLDKFFYSPTLIKKRLDRSKDPKKEKLDWTLRLLALTIFALAISFFYYFKKSGWVNLKEVITLRGLQLDRPLQKESTGGRSLHYDYIFHFRDYPNRFPFQEDYYRYASEFFDADYLQPGDTITIQIRRSEYQDRLRFPGNGGKVDILNLIKNGQPLVNLESRNEKKLEWNRRLLTIAALTTLAAFFIMIIRHKMAADNDRRRGLARTYFG
jgi:hypothetical protein